MFQFNTWPLLLGSLVVGPALAEPFDDATVLTMAHRGTSDLSDENTIEAMNIAYEYGVHIVEVDPRITSDGVYVLMHDRTVDRTTNGHGLIAEMTFNDVSQLTTKSGYAVPTLEHVLQFARERDLILYIDIKEPPDFDEMIRVIEKTKMAQHILLGCYELKTLKTFKERRPSWFAFVTWPIPALSLRQADRLNADGIATLIQLASKRLVRRAHKRGLKVVTMPANHLKRVEKLLRNQVDVLQSDELHLLKSHGRTNGSPDMQTE
jgi:glycerophosphoryl diester phosphodiesterase